MPHVIVKMKVGRTEEQKQALAAGIVREVVAALGNKPETVSVAIDEIAADDWKDSVYTPLLGEEADNLVIRPGYTM